MKLEDSLECRTDFVHRVTCFVPAKGGPSALVEGWHWFLSHLYEEGAAVFLFVTVVLIFMDWAFRMGKKEGYTIALEEAEEPNMKNYFPGEQVHGGKDTGLRLSKVDDGIRDIHLNRWLDISQDLYGRFPPYTKIEIIILPEKKDDRMGAFSKRVFFDIPGQNDKS